MGTVGTELKNSFETMGCESENVPAASEMFPLTGGTEPDPRGFEASHYTHLPPLYPIVLSDEHRERADELGEAGV